MGSSDLFCSLRKLFISICIFGFMAAGVISCTTGEDSADGFEDELSSEMEQLEGAEESETTEVAEEEGSDEEASTEDKDATEMAADDDGEGDSSEDDEFLAEDTPAPTNKENLEEKDLQNELEKEAAVAAVDPTANPAADPAVTPEPVNQQPPAVAAGTVTPTDMEDPLVEDGEVALPNSAATSSPLVRRDSTPDGFEIINPPVPQEDLGVSDPLVAEVDPPLPSVKAAQEIVPISKINKDPFFRNERLMNSVYVVRPNDDLAIISQKIFNDDKTSILFADNPHLSKGLETGDKVYYNSPNRPDDKKTIMTFYEDNKMAPQYYVTRRGDDIKKIGREVLGNEDGWKEIWATNESLQTQALLPAGLKVRYWSGSEPRAYEEPQNNLASNASDEVTSAGATMSQTPTAPETLPEIPPSPEPANVISEDPGMMASAPTESLPSTQNSEVPSVKTAEEGTSILSVAAIAMIAMAGLGIVAIQIKNRKRDDGGMPPSLEFTKV